MNDDNFIPLDFKEFDESTMLKKSIDFLKLMDKRRSVRSFSTKPVSEELVKNIIMTASSAPSGAHKQPWFFCAVSNAETKHKIRIAAEEEEYKSYNGRMSEEWLNDLTPFATNHIKAFIDDAPWLIIVFKKPYDLIDGDKKKNYYTNESVGIAVGFLLSAIHNAGLVALTHTPSPMNFLEKILNRPDNEKSYLLIPVGYPAENAEVPMLKRKSKKKVLEIYN